MKMDDPILEFEDVTVAAAPPCWAGLERANARFLPGTLTLIRAEEGGESPPIADVAEGLLRPDTGRVRFLGEEWSAAPPERGLELRGLIGRVFDGCGWISNLSVEENVALSARHHTARLGAEILAEAASRARAFGLDGLPSGRPALVPRGVLRRAEWVRAFLGAPRLILLEHPMRGVHPERLPSLVAAVREACARGAAVVWMSSTDGVGPRDEAAPAVCYAVRGTALVHEG